MTSEGMLEPGDIFKTATKDVWYVDTVSPSGAYCIHLSAHPSPITTRKGATKIVNKHLRNSVFSLHSVVDLVDQSKLDPIQLRRRLFMARKEGTVAETETAGTEVKEAKPVKEARVPTNYVRTDKTPAKELRGQSAEVFAALNKAEGAPRNAEELAKDCTFAGSRQDPVRVVNFYLAQFKKDGLIVVAPTASA